MRDKRFIAEHRGGPLKKEQHRQLMDWACSCAEHVLVLCDPSLEEGLKNALSVARDWKEGRATVGEAQKAAWKIHATARECSDPVSVAVARAVGHTVATAHMADHALGSALYALNAVKLAGLPPEMEKKWQLEQLSDEIRELVITSASPAGIAYAKQNSSTK
jgi:hypothetical protein